MKPTSKPYQPGIFDSVPAVARHVFFALAGPGVDAPAMPWMMSMQAGLMFVAFGRSFDAFEAQMRRMAGRDDGITDAMFHISRPVSGAYFWCPPMRQGKLDLRQLGL